MEMKYIKKGGIIKLREGLPDFYTTIPYQGEIDLKTLITLKERIEVRSFFTVNVN